MKWPTVVSTRSRKFQRNATLLRGSPSIGMVGGASRCRQVVLACICCSLVCSNVLAGRIGFLVAEFPDQVVHGDSFVITIDEADTDRLTHARNLVDWIEAGMPAASSPDGKIVFTAIATGADGINRDLLAPSQPEWSWHPIGEVDFVDISAEIYDGWPTFVEVLGINTWWFEVFGPVRRVTQISPVAKASVVPSIHAAWMSEPHTPANCDHTSSPNQLRTFCRNRTTTIPVFSNHGSNSQNEWGASSNVVTALSMEYSFNLAITSSRPAWKRG